MIFSPRLPRTYSPISAGDKTALRKNPDLKNMDSPMIFLAVLPPVQSAYSDVLCYSDVF